MKKLICLLLITVLVFGTASACTTNDCSGPGPMNPIFYFNSMEEFFAFFKMDTELGEIPAVYWNFGNNGKPVSEDYTAFINKMIAEPSIHVPMQDGEMIPFYDRGEGASSLTLHSAGGYGSHPEICYYVLAENEMVIIRIEYLDAEIAEFAKNNSCIAVVEKLSPNSNKTSWGEKIYEKEIVLSDRKVSARVKEVNDEDEIFVKFVYDDIFVDVQARPEIITAEWFGGLSFEEYTE